MTTSVAAAFDLLGNTVRERHEQGRRTIAASLKPRLQQLSAGSFDETLLGFRSFRDFLREGEARRVVSLHSGAVDLLVTPPGLAPPAEEPRTTLATPHQDGAASRSHRRIRPNLWRAFVDWTPGTVRFFDRQQRQAFSLPAWGSPHERGEQLVRREAVAAEPSRFVGIDPIRFEEQLRWMHAFADRQLSPIREQLQIALASERPARDFTGQLRAVPAISDSWYDALVDEVRDVITRWVQSNDVDVEIFEPERSTRADGLTRRRESAVVGQSVLRSMLHRAIDRMPEHELAAISLPVGYLVDTARDSAA